MCTWKNGNWGRLGTTNARGTTFPGQGLRAPSPNSSFSHSAQGFLTSLVIRGLIRDPGLQSPFGGMELLLPIGPRILAWNPVALASVPPPSPLLLPPQTGWTIMHWDWANPLHLAQLLFCQVWGSVNGKAGTGLLLVQYCYRFFLSPGSPVPAALAPSVLSALINTKSKHKQMPTAPRMLHKASYTRLEKEHGPGLIQDM